MRGHQCCILGRKLHISQGQQYDGDVREQGSSQNMVVGGDSMVEMSENRGRMSPLYTILNNKHDMLPLAKYFSERLSQNIFFSFGLKYEMTVVPDDVNYAEFLYLKLKRRIDLFEYKHGVLYSQLLSRVELTIKNIQEQYHKGMLGVMDGFGNQMTAGATIALFVYLSVLLRHCLATKRLGFTEHLVEWNCRFLGEYDNDLQRLGCWESVLCVQTCHTT